MCLQPLHPATPSNTLLVPSHTLQHPPAPCHTLPHPATPGNNQLQPVILWLKGAMDVNNHNRNLSQSVKPQLEVRLPVGFPNLYICWSLVHVCQSLSLSPTGPSLSHALPHPLACPPSHALAHSLMRWPSLSSLPLPPAGPSPLHGGLSLAPKVPLSLLLVSRACQYLPRSCAGLSPSPSGLSLPCLHPSLACWSLSLPSTGPLSHPSVCRLPVLYSRMPVSISQARQSLSCTGLTCLPVPPSPLLVPLSPTCPSLSPACPSLSPACPSLSPMPPGLFHLVDLWLPCAQHLIYSLPVCSLAVNQYHSFNTVEFCCALYHLPLLFCHKC
jgi:hypothetical protein